jgi:hypothetical protein
MFSDKDPGEAEFLGFNFAPRLAVGETILTAAFSIAAVEGTDEGAGDMLSGAAIIDGSIVKQLVGGGLDGGRYRLAAEVTTSGGQTLVESALLRVREIG